MPLTEANIRLGGGPPLGHGHHCTSLPNSQRVAGGVMEVQALVHALEVLGVPPALAAGVNADAATAWLA